MKYFSRSRVFLGVLISFCLGVFVGPYVGGFFEDLGLIAILVFCYAVIFLLIIFRKKKLSLCLVVFMISCLMGIWCYQSYLPKIDEGHVGFYVDNGERYLVEGAVDIEPEEKGGSLKLQITNIMLITNSQFSISNQFPMINDQLKGKILLSIPKHYKVKYGDRVQFSAKLASPKEYDDFDYKSYLARYGVYAIAKSVDGLEVIDGGSCRDAKSCVSTKTQKTLFKIKNYFSSIIAKIYPEPHSAFMLGLLVGEKKSMPDWLLEIFRIVGITHIIAISGYNITILAKVAEKTLGKVGRRFIFWGVLIMILFFVIMTGAQASIVRAGVMGALLVYAGHIGRRSNVIGALVLAGAIMIFLNPLILRNDAGFRLSFLATLGLVYISPIFESWLKKVPGTISQLLSATLAAQVLTLPIIISSFGLVSLISPLANILVLPFIPTAMFLGFLSGGLGILFLPLGQIVGFFGYTILEIIIKISEVLSRIPYASVELKMNNWYIWLIYYVVTGLLVWAWYRRGKDLKIKMPPEGHMQGPLR